MKTTNLKTMTWLLKREYWEHKGSLILAPLIISAVMLVISVLSLANMKIDMGEQGRVTPSLAITIFNKLTPAVQNHIVATGANAYMAMAAPVFIVMVFAIFLFCINSLYDERKDRSILFWKSLPISDHATVLSKLAVALVFAPLASLCIATVLCVLQLLIFCSFALLHGANIFGLVFGRVEFYMAPVYLFALLPVYMLCALPTIGWLMLVSSWARSKVFLWAVVAPVVAGVLLWWSIKISGLEVSMSWYWNELIVRGLMGLIPGVWFKLEPDTLKQLMLLARSDDRFALQIVRQSWDTLTYASPWIAGAVGALMIYAAIRLRARQDEG